MTTYKDFNIATQQFLTDYGMDNLNRDYLSDNWHRVYTTYKEFLTTKSINDIANSTDVNDGMVRFIEDCGIVCYDNDILEQYLQSYYLYGFEVMPPSSFKVVLSINPVGVKSLLYLLMMVFITNVVLL